MIVDLRSVSHSQASIFFAEVGAAQAGPYNVVVRVDVTGAIGDDEGIRACRALVAATPVLRLRIGVSPRNGELVSFFGDEAVEVEVAAEEEGLVDAFILRPFEVDEGPLVRALITRTSAGTMIVRMVMHHLVVDGVGHNRLTERLAELLAGRPVEPEAERDYTDLVEWVRAQELAAREQDRAYWEDRLAEVDLAETPVPVTGVERPAARRVLVAGPETTAGIADTAEVEGRSVFQLLTAAVHAALPVSGKAAAVGIAATQRPRGARGARVCGSFVNEVPLIAVCHEGDGPLDVVRVAGDRWAQDLRRRNYPLLDLAGELGARGIVPAALNRVMASYRTDPVRRTWYGPGRVCTGELAFASPAAKTDVAARFFAGPDGMSTEVQWSGRLLDGAGARVAAALDERVRTLVRAGAPL